MMSTERPLHLVIELVRAAEVAKAGGVASGEWNRYLLRDPDGSGRYEEGELLWDESMQADLSACADFASAGEAVERLAAAMRAFVDSAGWQRIAARIQATRAAGRPLALTVRSAAHELYTLPWELLDLAGAPVCETDCLLRYEWPGPGSAGALSPPRAGGRVLMAWSAAGGGVPAAEHIDAMAAAARAGHVPFDLTRDVVANASVASLEAALGAGDKPVTILHLLCHGKAMPDGSAYGLCLDDASGLVRPERIRALLAPYRDTLRLVVVSACLGSHPGAADNALGSVAQAIHEAGVPAVLASRYPLSVAGSVLLTRRLYQWLFVDLWSLEQSFLEVRAALRERERGPDEARDLDWAAVQLYSRAELGQDFRPWIIRPYRGLKPYRRKHERFFFGREQERRELCDRVATALASGGPRFLLVAGASGTGKSSLVLAALATDLEAGRMATDRADGAGEQGGPSWSTVVMRPAEGGIPSEILARRLDARRARLRNSGARSMVLLVVDQLEELFTSVSDQAQQAAFLRTLWRLAGEPDGDVFVVATIRLEYLGRFGNVCIDDAGVPFDHEMLASERHYLVRQMGPEQHERAICGPAEAAGMRLEPGLFGRLQAALRAEPGALPLLSYTLDQLWQKRSFATLELPGAGEPVAVSGWWLTDRSYDELGGIEGALATTADALFAQLGPAHQDELRRVLVQLVHDHEDVMLATRRRGWRLALRPDPVTEAGAARVFDETVDALVSARLLVQGTDAEEGAETWIELAHDSLIRFWPRLHAWYQAAREWLLHTDELRDLAAKWQPHARCDDTTQAREAEEPYLLRGHLLSYQLEMWQRHNRHLGARDRAEIQAFLDACARAEEARKAARLAREMAARRRTRIFALSAVAVAVVMSVLGVWARRQQLEADEQRSVADRERTEAQTQRAIAVERATAARDASIMAGTRELMARNQPAWATRLLKELSMPLDAHGWRVLALDALSQTRLIVTLRGHEKMIRDVAFSPNGTRVATASSDGTARVWHADGSGEPLVLRHDGEVNAVAFSPDGTHVATASSDGTARVWRVDGTGEPLVCRHDGEVFAVDISPDGKLVVTASDDRTARLWRVDDATPIAVLREHDVSVLIARFSPDGKLVVTGARDGSGRLWRMDDPRQSTALTGHGVPVHAADFSPDGTRVIMAGSDGTARIWPVENPRVSMLLSGHDGGIRSVSFSPDGQHVMTASLDKTVRIWSASDPATFTTLDRHTEMAWFAAFSPDGRHYVTAFSDGTVRLWDATRKQVTHVVLAGHEDAVSSAAFSPDGKRLVTASADGTARIWHTGDADRFFTTLGDELLVRRRTVTSVSFNASGKLVLGLTSDDTAKVWRADGFGPIAELGGPERRLSAADLGPDGEHMATAFDGTLRLWRVRDAAEIAVVRAHESSIDSVRFSPDGELVVTASEDGTARLWRTRELDAGGAAGLAPLATLGHHEQAVTSATFSPDGKRVLTNSSDGTARIWKVADPAHVTVLRGPAGDDSGQIASAVFSPDSKLVATTSSRETCVWSIDDPAGATILRQYPMSDIPAQFSPDGLQLLTATKEVAQVRRLHATDQAIILRGHSDNILSASFSPDGKLVLTTARDGTSRIWSLDAPEQPALLANGEMYYAALFSPDGNFVIGRWRGRALIVPIGIEGLRARLLQANHDCLTPRMRQRYMGEIENDARRGYQDCELGYGRVPFDTRTNDAGRQP